MFKDMFGSARLRLTLFYLMILMVISVTFSSAIYNTASRELNRHATMQAQALNNMLQRRYPTFFRDNINLEDFENDQYEKARSRLMGQLIFVNVVTMVSGGLLCYWFAGRTLKPIAAAHEAQKRFAADAAHELRTPLTALKLENEVLLRSKAASPAEYKAQLMSNLEEINRLEGLSSMLLELAKLEAADLPLQTAQLSKLARQAVEARAKQAAAKHIEVAATTEKKVATDCHPESIVQLLSILIDNAIKYSDDGSKIDVMVTKQDKQAMVKVIDYGVGIAESEQAKIFDRFYRSEKSRTSAGYGLGLALAKEIANANNAELTVDSQLGEGSTFTLAF